MKYIGRMVTKLLLDENFIDPSERNEFIQQFDESFEKSEKNENKIVKSLNAVLSHPFGVILLLLGFGLLRRFLQKQSQLDASNDLQQQFKNEVKAQIYQDILNENKK